MNVDLSNERVKEAYEKGLDSFDKSKFESPTNPYRKRLEKEKHDAFYIGYIDARQSHLNSSKKV